MGLTAFPSMRVSGLVWWSRDKVHSTSVFSKRFETYFMALMINLLLIQQMPNEYLLYLDMGDLI